MSHPCSSSSYAVQNPADYNQKSFRDALPIVAFESARHGDDTRDRQPSATRADLTPPPPALPGAGRWDPGLQVDKSSDQRLAAVNSAPLTAEDRGAERAQRDEVSNQLVSSHPALAIEDSPGRAANVQSRVAQSFRINFPAVRS